MPATVYQRLCLSRKEFSRKDLRRIANWINAIYRKKFTEELPKVAQQEGDRVFQVFLYPDEMIPIMDEIITKFYRQKEYIQKKHQKYLESLKNKEKKEHQNKKQNQQINNKKNKSNFKSNDKRDLTENKFKNKEYELKSKPNKQKIEIPTVVTLRKRKSSLQHPQNNQIN